MDTATLFLFRTFRSHVGISRLGKDLQLRVCSVKFASLCGSCISTPWGRLLPLPLSQGRGGQGRREHLSPVSGEGRSKKKVPTTFTAETYSLYVPCGGICVEKYGRSGAILLT